MSVWPLRLVKPPIQATEDELIAGSQRWHDAMPDYRASRDEHEQWRRGYERWCADRGTDVLAVIRLRVRARGLRW
jgi:hypothetical protein